MTVKWMLLAVLLCLSGCASLDTGEISYRRAERLSVDRLADRVGKYESQTCEPHRRTPEEKKLKIDNDCEPLAPTRLFRQNIGTGDRIAPNDVFSIRLDHGLIAYLSEPPFSVRRLVNGKDPLRAVGEIVVLANTFEFPDDERLQHFTGDGKAPARFTDIGDLSQSRVVYYSPDVEQGQNLNFSNIPLQEPTRYTGNPIGIQIIVIELDRVSSGIGSLLKKLASLGQSASFVPGGEASKLLLDLGGSLAAQNHDDIIFEYRFVLDPSDGQIGPGSAPFEAGRYVLVREDERKEELNWRNMFVDHNTGRVFKYDTGKDGKTIYDGYDKNTYFTVNIIKHPVGTEASHYSFRSFTELGQMIEADANSRDEPFVELASSVDRKLLEMRGRSWVRDLIKAWRATADAAKRYAATDTPSDAGKCTLVSNLDAQRDVAQTEVRVAALAFAALFQQAAAQKPMIEGEEQAELPQGDQVKLLASLVPYFAPYEGGQIPQDKLMSADAFLASYTGDKAGEFAEAVVREADRRGKTNSCSQMISLGYATPMPALAAQPAGNQDQ